MNKQDKKKRHSDKNTNKFSFWNFVGGGIFTTPFFRRQMGLFILITIFTVLYIANRYAAEQEMREINALRKELTEIHYKILHLSSIFAEKSRQSHIEEYIQKNNSKLETASTPTFIIKK